MYFSLAPRVGFEPTTCRLTAGCSTTELSRNMLNFFSSSRCFFASSQLDIAILAHIINIVNCFLKIFKKFFLFFFERFFTPRGGRVCTALRAGFPHSAPLYYHTPTNPLTKPIESPLHYQLPTNLHWTNETSKFPQTSYTEYMGVLYIR